MPIHCYTSTKSLKDYIFTSVCLCVCVSVCVSNVFLWTQFQPNGYTDLDVVFAKWLLTALAWTLLKLLTLGQRSRSKWGNIHFFPYNSLLTSHFVSQLSYVRSKWNLIWCLHMPLVDVFEFHKKWICDKVRYKV